MGAAISAGRLALSTSSYPMAGATPIAAMAAGVQQQQSFDYSSYFQEVAVPPNLLPRTRPRRAACSRALFRRERAHRALNAPPTGRTARKKPQRR